MAGEIINRVAQSPIITFNLENHYQAGDRILIDIKDHLFRGMILREKDFRAWVKEHDWTQYQDKYIAITCSADAIVQVWAYMLLELKLQPYAKYVCFGSLEDLDIEIYRQALDAIDYTQFDNRPVVIKGCSKVPVPVAIYVEAARRIQPYAKKISYGEACSAVPLYKKK